MSTIVCQGSQSPLVESRIHRLRLPSPKPKPLTPQPIDLAIKSCFWESNSKPHCEEDSCITDTIHHNPISSNPNQGGWSIIQALSDVFKEPLDEETTYVHPRVKHSSVRLSSKSLELCTENLGNETGTDIIGSCIDLLHSSGCDDENLGTWEQRKSRQLLKAKKAKTHEFPPPLTTIRGSESLQVRPHREGGRLVIEVTKVPSIASFFHAERSHGRLRLCLLKNHTPSFDPEEDDNEGFEDESELKMDGQRQDVEEEEEEAEDNKKETELESVDNEDGDRNACVSGCKEIKGISETNKDGMRMGKYERPSNGSRCKEGDHENNELLLNRREPLWVATS